jgi:dihydroxy-acid dehydratase
MEIAQEAGKRIVGMVEQGLRPSAILTREAFENAIRANAAIGGSTNAIFHLTALAGRLGVELALDDFDTLARDVPAIVDLMPSGRFLMEDFCYAGGLLVVLRRLGEAGLLHAEAITVTGGSVRDTVADAVCWDTEVIRPPAEPLQPAGTGTAILRGNLCPDGAVIKQSAASPALMRHVGRALVFDSPEDYHAVCDDDDLDVTPVPARRLTLLVPEDELGRRRAGWRPPAAADNGGYRSLYREHVLQADEGADFGFLRGGRGHDVPRDSH